MNLILLQIIFLLSSYLIIFILVGLVFAYLVVRNGATREPRARDSGAKGPREYW